MVTGPDNLLLGPLSLDIYLAGDTAVAGGEILPGGFILPGGGALNMAWHWRRLGLPFFLLSRIGRDHPDLFLRFLDHQAIAYAAGSIVGDGDSASIDIEIRPDRQPFMDHFVEGVWADFRLGADEENLVRAGRRLHVVLVEGAISELDRLGRAGALDGIAVSADFLGFRHYTIERLADTMAKVGVGFIGWPGAPDDPAVGGMREVAFDLRRLLVVTMGAQAIRVFDGRGAPSERTFPVTPVSVRGTTLGCGDAFIAGFLAELWRTDDLDRAIPAGSARGALATSWPRPLPDDAYDSEIRTNC
jgi:sugar/nucleoside kinase (ribokinase family)